MSTRRNEKLTDDSFRCGGEEETSSERRAATDIAHSLTGRAAHSATCSASRILSMLTPSGSRGKLSRVRCVSTTSTEAAVAICSPVAPKPTAAMRAEALSDSAVAGEIAMAEMVA